ncbi:MAG: acetyl esterase/lipase, partial [Patescibacteria group bacterium]
MAQSITYYLTLFVLKLKGIKKGFSKDPINFKKIRREDVPHPKGKFFKQNQGSNFKVLKTEVTEVKRNKNSNSLLIFIHGGAFISGPAKHHWDTIQEIAKQTNHTIWMCNYPKAPEHKILEISENIDAVYKVALEKCEGKQIMLIGDSVGGTLIAALTQRLVKNNNELPRKIILVSPV